MVFRAAEDSDLESDDSGTDDNLNLLTSSVQDRYLNWITDLLNNSERVEEDLNPLLEKPSYTDFVITMTKILSCEMETCMDHVAWAVHVEKIKNEKLLMDLGPEGGILVKLEKWVNSIMVQHFGCYGRSSLLEILFKKKTEK